MMLKGTFCLVACAFALLTLNATCGFGQNLDADTKFRLAEGLERSGELERAAAIYRELYLQNPANVVYFENLDRVLVQLKRYDDAITMITGRLAGLPHDVSLLALLGSVYYQAGREQDAGDEWEKIIAIDPKNAGLYRTVANVLIENRLLDKAAETYRRGRNAVGDQRLFTLELSQVLIATMDYGNATKELLSWLDLNPAQLAFVESRMASFTAKPDGRQSAIEAVREALRQNEDPRRWELLGWLYLEGYDFEHAFEAYRMLDKLAGRSGGALYDFAERTVKAGAYEIAARAYQEAIAAPLPSVRLPPARYGYANALRDLALRTDSLRGPFAGVDSEGQASSDFLGKALNAYRAVIENHPHSEYSARSWYAIADIQEGKLFDVNSALTSLMQASSELQGDGMFRQQILLKTGELWLLKGDTVRAAQQYRAVASTPSAPPDQLDEANFCLAELDFFAGHFAEVTQRLASITVNLKADYANDALELEAFLTGNAMSPPDAMKEYAQAALKARQRHNSEAIGQFQHVVAAYPNAPLADDAMMRVGELQAQSGKFAEAALTYQDVLSRFKENSTLLDRAQFRIGELEQYGLHDPQKAVAAYEKLLSDFPRSVFLGEARKRIRQLRGEAL